MDGKNDGILQGDSEFLLAELARDLSENGQIDLLQAGFPPALVLFDVCGILGLDALHVLGIRMLMRIKAFEACRPWPTLSVPEDAELVELDNIRQSDNPRLFTPLTVEQIEEILDWDPFSLASTNA